MSEQELYPNDSASPKRGSSLLRSVGSSPSRAPSETGDQTVISSDPPMTSVNVTPVELEGPFRVGDRLGIYELTEYIGGGGMGSVYKATDTLLAREVAIKILLPEAAGNEEAVLRFQNEARSAARLDNESIAKVYYVGDAEGLPYLVFEFIPGVNLRDLVRQRGPLPLSDAIGIALQVADSLFHASQHGVVHRDVKPSNILLREDGQVKLIDFGLARIVEAEERDNDLTASGVTLGTFDYISPEQARDPRTVDIRSDIYSLGCTLFYILTGRPPFPEGTVLQKLLQHQGDRPPNVREFRPELPEEISLLLDRMLAKNPSDRFQTPLELREQIGLLASQLGLRSLSLGVKGWTLPTAPQPSFLSRHSPWILSVTVLVVIVLGLDYYWTPEARDSRNPKSAAVHGQTDPEDEVSPFPTVPEVPSGGLTSKTTSETSPSGPVTPETGNSTEEGKALAVRETTTTVDPPSTQNPLFPSGSVTDPLDNNPSDDIGNVKIKSSSPYWNPSGTYDIEGPGESATFNALPMINGTSRLLAAAAAFEDSLIDKNLTENQPFNNGNGNRDLQSSPSTPGTATRYGILTVGEPNEGSVSFSNLARACRAAATGDIIELRYNGQRIEPPLALSGKNLILRAAKGYQPSVVFRPSKSESVDPDPILTQNAMVLLNGGSLTAINVSFRLELDKTAPVDRWTLFEVQSGESIQLQKCRLSTQNQSNQTATFFRVATSPSDELADSGSIISVGPVAPAKIELTDSIVRGNATFLAVDDERPVDCSWDNGLLVTDGPMLDLQGSDTIWNHKDRVSLSLKHVTAFAAAGICRLGDDRQSPPTIPVNYVCYDSVILVSNTNAMITQWVDATTSFPNSRFRFEGDRNYYQGFDFFLIQKNQDFETDFNQLDFSAWQNRWDPDHESYSLWGYFAFIETPDTSKPLDQRGPADYTLSENPENPTRYAADDGSNLGFLLERLPTSMTPPDAP